MVEKPTYQAEQVSTRPFGALEAAINAFGERRADEYDEKWDRGAENRGHTEIDIDSWARGPLLRMEQFDSSGEQKKVTIGNSFTKVILSAGYVPWGFRPERGARFSDEGETQVETGRWMWYLRPIGDITDDEFPERKFALRYTDGGGLVRTEDGDAVTFEDANEAHAVAEGRDDVEIRKIVE